jgi:poly-gamma-glutamate capsule biosynthesis protein CapA/YwtB (metallophosphatase superfamily)
MRIAFLGDVYMGGAAEAAYRELGYGYAFRGLAPILKSSDFTVASLEGPLTRSTYLAPKERISGRPRFWQRHDPSAAEALAEAGVLVVSLANNHMLDCGPEALEETKTHLARAGILHCGAGVDRAAARRAVVVDRDGGRIGFLSMMQPYQMYEGESVYATDDQPGVNLLDPAIVATDAAALRDRVEMAMALVHWGRNYRGVTHHQLSFASVLCQAGFGAVIGHHPHVAQRLEIRGATPLIYSLGNGPFGSRGRFTRRHPGFGLVIVIETSGPDVTAIEAHLIVTDNARVRYAPAPASGPDARFRLQQLLPCEEHFSEIDECAVRWEAGRLG